jgi:hypothetical protein
VRRQEGRRCRGACLNCYSSRMTARRIPRMIARARSRLSQEQPKFTTLESTQAPTDQLGSFLRQRGAAMTGAKRSAGRPSW